MRKAIAVLLVMLVALPVTVSAVAGCGEKLTPEQAKNQLEDDLESLKNSLTQFANPATYSSQESMQNAIDDVEDDFNAVVSSAKEVKEVSTAQLSKAWDELKNSLSDTLESSESISEKIDSVQTALNNFQEAWQDLIDELQP